MLHTYEYCSPIQIKLNRFREINVTKYLNDTQLSFSTLFGIKLLNNTMQSGFDTYLLKVNYKNPFIRNFAHEELKLS